MTAGVNNGQEIATGERCGWMGDRATSGLLQETLKLEEI